MKKVLILEDEVNIRSFVVINLKRAGYDTIEAGTGAEALQRVRDEQDRRAKLEKIRQELEAAAAKAEQEKQEAPKPEPQAEKPAEKQPDPTATVNGRWIEFKAFLTAKQAAELKEFFTSRGILYGPVERGRQ